MNKIQYVGVGSFCQTPCPNDRRNWGGIVRVGSDSCHECDDFVSDDEVLSVVTCKQGLPPRGVIPKKIWIENRIDVLSDTLLNKYSNDEFFVELMGLYRLYVEEIGGRK